MDTSFEQKVRERAYEIWVAAGMTDGSATEHWLSAQHSLLSEFGSEPARKIQKAKVTKPRAADTTAKTAKAPKLKTRAA